MLELHMNKFSIKIREKWYRAKIWKIEELNGRVHKCRDTGDRWEISRERERGGREKGDKIINSNQI